MFEHWSRERIVARIDYLEEQLSLGVSQISNPDTGSASFSALEARRNIRDLKAALRRLDGHRPRSPFATYVPRIHPDR